MPIKILLLVPALFIVACSDQPATPSTDALDRILGKSQAQGQVTRDFDPAQIARGQAIFQKNCAGCHGKNAEGTSNWRKPLENGRYPPPPLNGTAHAWHHSTEELKQLILNGGPPGEGRMPGWADILTDQEINDVLVWIKSLWPDEVYEGWYTRIEHRQ